MLIPMVGADGIRQTVNARLSSAQRVWNMRSAFNVAALNCLEPRYAPILEGYKHYLNTHKKALTKTNKDVEAEWKKLHGAGYARLRDSYTTQVYNYFALPPVLPQFCDTALAISQESMTVPAAEFEPFSQRSLDRLEMVFETFFRSFEQYRVDVAAWDAKYGNLYGQSYVVRANATYPQSPPLITPVPQPQQPAEATPAPGFATVPSAN